MRILFIACIYLLISAKSSFAQDPVFSQPYMSPINLNPAATGAGDHDLRVSGIIRRQWWSIPSQFTYAVISIDKFLPSLQSGIGFMATTLSEGYIKKTGLHLSYAYTFCPGVSPVASNEDMPQWFLTGALQMGMVQRRVDYKKLLFADQIDMNGVIPGAETGADLPVNNGRWYLDVSPAVFFSYRLNTGSRILIGASAKHVNRPDESLTGTNSQARSLVPVLWSGNILYTNSNNDRWTYSLAANLSKQQNNQLLQVGVEVTQNEYDIGVAAWYRGGSTFQNPDAFTLSLSFNLSSRNNERSKIRAGISHDSPIGNKKYSNNNGSSEFAFVWDQDTNTGNGDNPCKPEISARECPRPLK
ncbi:MAG: PorP/SprF family type IX secretion system membrane protein [Ferruginibacter sp.]